MSRISNVLRGIVILEGVLLLLKRLFPLFGKHALRKFLGLVEEGPIRSRFHEKHTELKSTFVGSVYGLEGFILFLENNEDDKSLIRKPKL